MANSTISHSQNGVSIIVCTKRRQCMRALLRNYNRQNYKKKELIIILNHNQLQVDEYRTAAKPYKNVRVYSLPGRVSLGRCLNYGVARARYSLIAKFDDDDYYAAGYLTESVRTLLKTKADIVGKRAHYMYLGGKGLLLLRYPDQANQYVSLVQGATLLASRYVLSQVGFPDQNRGECIRLFRNSKARGYRIYSGSTSNFLAIRRRNSRNHTWIVSDRELLSGQAKVLKVGNPKAYVST